MCVFTADNIEDLKKLSVDLICDDGNTEKGDGCEGF